jgi:toxin-antitoxin system PIN domain toxin
MRALLDVNVLVAILDPDHLHHAVARNWLVDHIEDGWASCPLTQNGCIRILSQSAYPGALAPAAIADRLAEATATKWHRFWPDSISLLDKGQVAWSHILGSRQLTDVYLLSLAHKQGGRLVTFDRGVALATVPGAQAENLVLI